MTGRVLVAGVGNIFLGDDGFGSEVARRLASAELPDGVRVKDYGISGMHLAYDIADGYETTILIDAAPRGEAPGTVTVLEVGRQDRPAPAAGAGDPLPGNQLFNAHGMQPDVVFGVLDMLGAGPAAFWWSAASPPASTTAWDSASRSPVRWTRPCAS